MKVAAGCRGTSLGEITLLREKSGRSGEVWLVFTSGGTGSPETGLTGKGYWRAIGQIRV